MALTEVLRRFYLDFPSHPEEAKYNYVVSSSMKPTQVECARGSLNQVKKGGGATRMPCLLLPSPNPPPLSLSLSHTHTLSLSHTPFVVVSFVPQVPPHATFSGDIRLTPFYDIVDVKAKVEGCVNRVMHGVDV